MCRITVSIADDQGNPDGCIALQNYRIVVFASAQWVIERSILRDRHSPCETIDANRERLDSCAGVAIAPAFVLYVRDLDQLDLVRMFWVTGQVQPRGYAIVCVELIACSTFTVLTKHR